MLVLEGKARAPREKGHGKRTNATNALLDKDQEQLWKNRVLGEQNPKSLLYNLWFLFAFDFVFEFAKSTMKCLSNIPA